MHGSYRRYILAGIGCIAGVIALAILYYPEQPRLPVYEEPQQQQAAYRPGGADCDPLRLIALKGAEAASKRAACDDAAEQHRIQSNDLVQQTRAADAARESVVLNYHQTILLFLGTAFGLLTLLAAGAAAWYAGRAYKIAKNDSDIENRPFLFLKRIDLKKMFEDDGKVVAFRICYVIMNSGKLPAYKIRVHKSALISASDYPLPPEFDEENPVMIENCPPGVERYVFEHVTIDSEYVGMFNGGFASVYLALRMKFDSRTVKGKTVTEERNATINGLRTGLFYFIQPVPDAPLLDFIDAMEAEEEGDQKH